MPIQQSHNVINKLMKLYNHTKYLISYYYLVLTQYAKTKKALMKLYYCIAIRTHISKYGLNS